MARMSFINFNGKTMSDVRTNITQVALVKPLNVSSSTTATQSVTGFIDAGSNTIKLLAIGTTSTYDTYTVEPSRFIQAGQTASVSDLTVTGNTTLGTDSTNTISLTGEIIGTISGPNAAINVQAASAATVNATTISATTVNATTVNAANLSINGVAYLPFYVSNATPAASYRNRLWVNTAATVPYLEYYNGSTWVSIGAVFG